jgi:hypothetical protein
MSIIKEQIRALGLDTHFEIGISSDDGFLGYQQEIDNLTQRTMLELVNPVNDVEKRKFKPSSTPNLTIYQFFFNGINSFEGAGFTENEILSASSNMLNSFFILDFYDTYNPNTQNKLFTSYLTKLTTGPVYYVLSNKNLNQLYFWYVPTSYINIQTGSTTVVYLKLSFYNAKYGNVSTFYNNYNAALTTPEKLYFKCELNLVDKTWKFLNLNSYHVVNAQELTTSVAYNSRVDKTFVKYDATNQDFPSGNTYYYKTNKYIDTDNNII